MNDVESFIANIENEAKRNDAVILLELLTEVSSYTAKLQGSIIGFGQYHYKYESCREGDAAVIAFSPRKQNIVLYIMPGFCAYQTQLKQLGKYKLGKSCLYINKLDDVDLDVLTEIARLSVTEMQRKYTCIAS
ncbi:DUF1801 domain-containing protein [Cognaticolwellia mytili]|uniref:DUF1801 domain-containing protein n=1 Tax=Cognaticolwellia mytili TaxID=1888913 RepID=UPI000A16FD7F|nr:DUF1801 domain-containing protein [Cognaticolwellia mytili]